MPIIGLETTDELEFAIDTVKRHECEAEFIGDHQDEDGFTTVLMEFEPISRTCLISLLIAPDVTPITRWPEA